MANAFRNQEGHDKFLFAGKKADKWTLNLAEANQRQLLGAVLAKKTSICAIYAPPVIRICFFLTGARAAWPAGRLISS